MDSLTIITRPLSDRTKNLSECESRAVAQSMKNNSRFSASKMGGNINSKFNNDVKNELLSLKNT